MSSLETLNLMLGFQVWAEDRGYDLSADVDGNPTNLETRAAWLGFEAAHGPAGCMPKGQQLYALIKKSSEYAHQTDKLFPVRVCGGIPADYVVRGGPGGVYRMKDVELYVIDDGKQYRLK
ncbi:hypothetical protein WLF18_18505 [Pseudomonas shirazensis]|uniref:Uncharacterized protein n=1 Tax=Pseudomonas shirazensis TaxID=2745494 RepID=A0ABU9A3C0_9PSED